MPEVYWRPIEFLRRVRWASRRPADVLLALQLGYFMWRTPGQLAKTNLSEFLDQVRRLPRRFLRGIPDPVDHIARLRGAWFFLDRLRGYDTCYMRALTLYRFLPLEGAELRIHFTVEPARDGIDRLRGHAWVTADDEVLEERDTEAIQARGQRLFTHPVGI